MRLTSEWFTRRPHSGGQISIKAESWLGSTYLGEIPVIAKSWRVEDSADAKTGGTLAFQVANIPELRPLTPDHPLASYGQQIRFSAGWVRPNGTAELVRLGSYRIATTLPTSRDIQSVTCESLLTLIDRAKFFTPYRSEQITRTATLERLTQGIIPLSVEGLGDPMLPPFVCEEDRLAGIYDIVESWPARLWTDDTGVLVISPPWDDSDIGMPAMKITDGPIGTLISITHDPDPSPGINGIKVETVPEGDQAPIYEVVTIHDGPMRWGGPYGYVTGRYASPLLPHDRATLMSVGWAKLARSQQRRDNYKAVIAPSYHLQVGDIVTITSKLAGIDITARITKISHTHAQTEITASYLQGARP